MLFTQNTRIWSDNLHTAGVHGVRGRGDCGLKILSPKITHTSNNISEDTVGFLFFNFTTINIFCR